MKRLFVAPAMLVAGLLFLAPVTLAAEPLAHTGRVILSTQGDVTVPTGDQADVVVVISGAADIRGAVNTLVVIDGTANLSGARLETVVAVRSDIEVGAGTVVLGEVKRLEGTIHQSGNAQIAGGITDLAADFMRFGAVLGPALVLLWLGFGLATIVAALAIAGLATRQVREAERLISAEPVVTGLTGVLAVVLLPVLAAVLITTLIGAPLGVGILIGVLPALAFVGYLVAGIWIGDRLLGRGAPEAQGDRPYLSAVLGVLVLEILALIPILGLAVVFASFLGFGALIRQPIHSLRGRTQPVAGVSGPLGTATQA